MGLPVPPWVVSPFTVGVADATAKSGPDAASFISSVFLNSAVEAADVMLHRAYETIVLRRILNMPAVFRLFRINESPVAPNCMGLTDSAE